MREQFQTTIRMPFQLEGHTLYNNYPAIMICEPYDDGIVFEVNKQRIPANYKYIDETETRYTTTLTNGKARVSVTEHLLSAFWGMGVDNVLIKLYQEEPPFCASAIDFVKMIEDAGIEAINKKRQYMVFNHTHYYHNNDKSIMVGVSESENDELNFDMDVRFNLPIGEQRIKLTWSPEVYKNELAWSRTFLHYAIDDKALGWERICKKFKSFPLNPKDCKYLIYNHSGYVVKPRGENEIARHKLLDFIGDFALLGVRPIGNMSGYCTGHAFNRKTVTLLSEDFKENIL